jgi:hypothetical protein
LIPGTPFEVPEHYSILGLNSPKDDLQFENRYEILLSPTDSKKLRARFSAAPAR